MRSRSLLNVTLLAVTVISLAATPSLGGAGEHGKLLIKLDGASSLKTDADVRARLQSLSSSKALGLRLEKRTVYGWAVVALDGATSEDATRAAMDTLRDDKAVAAVDRITRKQLSRAPNDEFFADLWGFAAIDVPTAWDTTIGLASQRIGVIDSGINRDHVDLIEHDVFGFDFISDRDFSADGDGRDAEYDDTDFAGSFHGSHVAGTMSASADDSIGVPGLNWNAGLVTARALSAEGGSVVDIAEAAAWLAGQPIDGVPSIGANRVSVINMSLGADEPCGAFENDVYRAITDAGVTVVAAAGNAGNDVPTGSPASCDGVIAVAASGPDFTLASYSNFDERIDVVAPGGDGFGGVDESILSVDGSGDFTYVAIDGTSMATPHVTGIVSLMQAVNPSLSPRQIKDILQRSPFTCAAGTCNSESFLDAPDAINQALATDGELDEQAPPSATCPPNSTLGSDGETCFCNAGFVVNAAQTACVADDSDDDTGGNTGAACPANSTLGSDGETCFCDEGFEVNAAQTGCVREDKDEEVQDDDEDEDSDDDDDRADASSFGCSSTAAPQSLVAFAALLMLVRRRRSA